MEKWQIDKVNCSNLSVIFIFKKMTGHIEVRDFLDIYAVFGCKNSAMAYRSRNLTNYICSKFKMKMKLTGYEAYR